MSKLVFFGASDGDPATVWVTDGTPAGTRPLGAPPGTEGLTDPRDFTALASGQMLFSAVAEGLGRELWVSDGTAEGTRLVKDIMPGDRSGVMAPHITVDNKTYDGIALLGDGRAVFSGNDGVHGRELWVTDGTETGTRLLKDINPSGDSGPSHFYPLSPGLVLFFATDEAHGREPWVTDGTEAGTRLVYDINPGPSDSFDFNILHSFQQWPPLLPFQDGRAILVVDDGTHGREPWITDGTPGGTFLLADVNEGEAHSELRVPIHTYGTYPAGIRPDGSFQGNARVEPGRQGSFVTDGTREGTDWTGRPADTPLPEPFELGPGEGIYMAGMSVTRLLMDDGRWIFSARAEEKVFDTDAQGNEVIRTIDYGVELWVSDGTQGGTRMIKDINPGPAGGGAVDFRALPDGRVLFVANDGGGRALWITDGNSASKVLDSVVNLGFFHTFETGTMLLSGRMLDGTHRLWLTDGSGLQTVGEDASVFSTNIRAVGDGRWLFDVTNHATDPVSGQTWISDGTVAGTRMLVEGLHRFDLLTLIDRNLAIFRQREGDWRDPDRDDPGREPAVINLATGQITLLEDIWPGRTGSQIVEFGVLPADVPPPVSTLFDERASMPGEESAFVLDDYFTDPGGGALSYTVTGLPAGIAFDPGAARVGGTLPDAPGTYEVRVTAESAPGVATTSAFDWIVPDTGLLRVSAEQGWYRAEPGGPIQSVGGDVLIGHRDGEGPLLRVENGGVKLDGATLGVAGEIWSAQLEDIEAPLMLGSFGIDVNSLSGKGFEDFKEPESLSLVGGLVDMGFSAIDIRPERVVFATDLSFAGDFASLSTSGSPLALRVGPEWLDFGPSMIGIGGWTPSSKLNIPGTSTMTLKFESLGLFYDFVTDDLYLNGKAKLEWGGPVAANYSFLKPGKESGLTIDLMGKLPDGVEFGRGDKYLRLGFDDDGAFEWDIVGAITYTGKGPGILPTGWPKLTELKLEIDTPKSSFKGELKAEFPWLFPLADPAVQLEAGVGAKWAPEVALDSFFLGIDNLNIAVGTTPLFVQGGKLGVEGLADLAEGDFPALSAELRVTLGATMPPLPAVLRGNVNGKIEPGKLELGFQMDSKVEYFLPSVVEEYASGLMRWFDIKPEKVAEFTLLEAKGTAKFDILDPSLTAKLNTSLLGGLYTGVSEMALFRDEGIPVLTASSKGVLAFPDPLPLVGGLGLAGEAALQYVHDDDDSNDFAAAWTTFDIGLGSVFGASFGMGVRLGFDGSVGILGRKDIEVTSSWNLSPEQDIVILSAYWDTPSDDARLELILPGNVVLTEADIALRDDIALVEDLNSPTARHVAIAGPTAGIWDLRLADPTGLGEIRLEASEMLPTPVARIATVELDDSLTATVTLTGPEALAAPVSLFLAPEPDAAAGLGLIAMGTLAPGETLTTVQDFAGLEPGEWWLHARTEADGHIPGLDMFATPITVEGAADLGVTIREGLHRETGSRSVTVEVANVGERASGDGSLRVSVSETLLGATPLDGFAAFAAADARLDLPSLAPGATQSFGFVLPEGAPEGAEIRLTAEAAAWDANPSDNILVFVLDSLASGPAGQLLARDGAPMAETALTLRLADGSTVAAVTDPEGRFAFDRPDLADAVLEGPAWSAATGPAITTASALEALRLAVGLPASWGPPTAQDFIAADVNGDGRVTTADALEILRTAVGLPSDHAPRWIFFETGHDFGTVDRTSVPTDLAPDLAALADPTDLSLTALLTGHVTAWT